MKISKYAQFLIDCRDRHYLEIWENQSYFKIQELVPKNTYERYGESAILLFPKESILTLLELRILADTGIIINTWFNKGSLTNFQYRGYRPLTFYTADVISKGFISQHCLFQAFDFNVLGYTCDAFREQIVLWKKEGKLPYLSRIEAGTDSWVHIDVKNIYPENSKNTVKIFNK